MDKTITWCIGIIGVGTGICCIVAAILCQQPLPTLNHMISVRNSAPFITTALNCALAAQIIATILLYKKAASYVHVIGSSIMYIGILISVITFPLGYAINYATIATLAGVAAWMVSCLAVVKMWYMEHVVERKTRLYTLAATFGAFVLVSAVYMGLKFSLQNDIGVFVAELGCGLLIVSFVIQIYWFIY